MNNLHYDYSIGWFTDWLDQKYEIEKKFINVHLPCGNSRLERGKKLFLAMAKECEKRSFFIRFVVTDPTVKNGKEGDWLIDREEVIETKALNQYLGLGVNSLTISENHEVRLQGMYLQELESRKDLNLDYDIFVTDYVPDGDENNDVIFPFDEYVIQRLSGDGLIINFLIGRENKTGKIDSYWGRVHYDDLKLIQDPTEIWDYIIESTVWYDVWKKGPAEV